MSTDTTMQPTVRALEQMVYHAVMELSPWPMAEVEGSAHLVQAINPAFCALLKRDKEELIGKPLELLFSEKHTTLGLLDRVLRTGEAATHVETWNDAPGPVYWSYTCWPVQAQDSRHAGLMIQVTETAAPDKQTVAMNEALLVSSVQQHELTAAAEHLNVQLVKEIAERERSQELLRRNRDTFFTLIDKAPFGLYVVDEHFSLRQVSTAAQKVFMGIDPLIGRNFEEVVRILWPDPFASEVIDHFHHTLDTGLAYAAPISTEHRLDVDHVESYDWKIERITLPEGQFGVVCYFYDVTAQKEAQEVLREADRRKSEFLATLAHELRNPLAPLRNGLELLTFAQQDQPTLDQAHGMMKRQLDQIVLLIDDLMDLSRISRGVIDLRKERLDLRAVLEQTVEGVRPIVEKQGHTLVLDLPDTPVQVEGDALRLAQVFSNLLNNAAKYTDRGGAIAVQLNMNDHEATVAVEDNGIGIAPEQIQRVFDMFAQVERSNDRVQGGLGIGLNIVKHLVGMHDGRIMARSDGLGKGSTFTVVLPLASPAPVQAEAPPKKAESAKVAPHRILIVDDNEDAANMMAMLLKKSGHEVRVAHNGEQALEEGKSLLPEVVLMDLGMPVMDGCTACRHMRGTTWGAKALIVALSGWGQEEDREKSHAAGFDHHMVKPIPSEEVFRLIATAAAGGGVKPVTRRNASRTDW